MDKPGASSFWAPGLNMDMNKPEQFLYEFCRGSLLTKYVKLLLQPRQKEKKPHKLRRSSPHSNN